MMTGRRIDAAEGERIGFVTQVGRPRRARATVDRLATTLAAKSPAVLRLGRGSFYDVLDRSGGRCAARCCTPSSRSRRGTEDAAEGITAFTEKRPPTWTGR